MNWTCNKIMLYNTMTKDIEPDPYLTFHLDTGTNAIGNTWPINTDTPLPFIRPSTHTMQEPDNNSIISGPSTPPKSLGLFWSNKTWSQDPFPNALHTNNAVNHTAIAPTQDHPSKFVTPFQDHLTPILVPFQDHHHQQYYA